MPSSSLRKISKSSTRTTLVSTSRPISARHFASEIGGPGRELDHQVVDGPQLVNV